MKDLFRIAKRVYVITGAASGIGRATAVLLSELGGHLRLIDRDEQGLDRTLSACLGNSHSKYVFDLRNVEKIDSLVLEVVKEGGLLNGIVHCAGIQNVAPARSLSWSSWRDILAVNTESAFALARTMSSKKVYTGQGGSIVFISSIMGVVGDTGAAAYCASKSALIGIARSLALEFASRQIRVNCIAPGFVCTPMLDRVGAMWTEEQRKAVAAKHPLGFGTADDIANSVAFLLGDTSRWITGSTIVADGGYLAQ